MDQSFYRYWAKSVDDPSQYHLLAYHSLDVAAVGYEYLQQDTLLRQRLGDAFHIQGSNPSPRIHSACFICVHGSIILMMDRFTVPLLLLLAGVIAISSCGCVSSEVPLSPDEQAAIIAFANPVTDNLMQGFSENNYTLYSRDFSIEMREGLDEVVFEENRDMILSKIGPYVSRGDPVVTESGEYLIVRYPGEFVQEEDVEIKVVFRKGDDSHQVYGLWFNSPKLRS